MNDFRSFDFLYFFLSLTLSLLFSFFFFRIQSIIIIIIICHECIGMAYRRHVGIGREIPFDSVTCVLDARSNCHFWFEFFSYMEYGIVVDG